MLRVTKGLVTVAVILYSIPLTGWLLFRYWKGEAWPMVGFLNAVGIWWFAPLVILLPVALLVRARQASLMSGIILLVGVSFFGAEFTPARARAEVGETPRLQVLTFNVLVSNRAFDEVVETIQTYQPDVIAVQELSPEMADALSASLRSSHPYQLLHPWRDPSGIGLLSRYPLEEGPTFSSRFWNNWGQAAIVNVEGHPVYLINVHLWPIGTLDREQFSRALLLQHSQVRELLTAVEEVDLPLLVVGDFNASPTNETYAMLSKYLDDVWRKVGMGPGFTFPSPAATFGWEYPFLRIDYIWMRGAISPLSIRVLRSVTGSDHLPLLAEFAVTPQSALPH
ncbi:MAG: endonuclease/exonuclease/phosphatase family protein [Chloroflexota bacterium]|nr:endonuclease/exonuclease/phosphatase family protein [Chloroflexota bacterium]